VTATGAVAGEAKREADEEHRLQEADKDKLVNDLRRPIDQLKRKSEQGVPQTLGVQAIGSSITGVHTAGGFSIPGKGTTLERSHHPHRELLGMIQGMTEEKSTTHLAERNRPHPQS
jgi:hypothetical protein